MSDDSAVAVKLFDAIGIKRVVYVDDRFGVTRERIASSCRELTPDQIAASNVFAGIDLTDDEALREQRLSAAIEAIADNALQGAFDAIQAAVGHGPPEQDRLAANKFSEIIGTAAEIMLLSLAEWNIRSTDLIAEMATKSTLFVFDDDFRLEGGNADDGRRLIAGLHATLQQYKYAYALLTHNATNDSAEVDLEKAIAQQYPAIEDFVVVIAKTRLTGVDSDRFIHRLKSTLLFRFFRQLRTKLTASAADAHNKALERINSFGIDEFERIIYRSSRQEGAWSPETLVRIFGVIHERELRSRLRRDESLHQVISDIDPLCCIETPGISDDLEKAAKELQRAEIYDSGPDLNALHLPLECGDIFNSDVGDQFVVVAQGCDLVVRDDGKRRKDAREERQLVTMLKLGSRQNKKNARFQDNEYELSHFDSSSRSICFTEVNQIFHVPAWILDLAVLNSEGICSISDSQPVQPLLTLPWQKRLTVLKARAADVVALFDATSLSAEDKREELLRSLLRLPLSTNFPAKIDPPNRNGGSPWQLCVGLRRTLRLRERYAAALLGFYANYLSRPDHPHDLTHGV